MNSCAEKKSSDINIQFQAEMKREERMKRLKELHMKRNEARTLNYKEVIEEDKRNKLPSNYEAKRKRTEWILEDDARREAALAEGKNYDRIKMLDQSAEDAEKQMWHQKKKKNPDPGFSDFEAATVRQYNRCIKNMQVDMVNYYEQKEKLGDAFYANAGTVLQGLYQDDKKKVDQMAENLEKQIAKRQKYSRRRMYDADADIDFINERNMKFNKKLERFYGQYTSEIKQNLERGTAV